MGIESTETLTKATPRVLADVGGAVSGRGRPAWHAATADTTPQDRIEADRRNEGCNMLVYDIFMVRLPNAH